METPSSLKASPRLGPVDGGIYVLTIDGEYRIKYLSKIKNGLLVSSENSAYRPEEYVGDECDRLKILGRVLEVNRSL